MNEEAQAQAWVREKPRKTIHNQALIQLLIVFSLIAPMPLAGVMFWLVFGIAPAIVIPSVVVIWVIASVTYTVLWLHVQRQNKKSHL